MAQNMYVETNTPELIVDENGKVSEMMTETTSSSVKAEHIKTTSGSDTLSPLNAQPSHYRNSQILFSNSNPDMSDDEGEEEDRGGTAEKAIITTHISAQRMHDPEFTEEFKTLYGDRLDNEGGGKLGGIRVVIEQVFEVEIDVASRERMSVTA